MGTFFKHGLLVLWTCLAAGLQARAQILCERVLPSSPTTPYSFSGEALLRVRPDSLRLIGSFNSVAGNAYLVKQRMVRVSVSSCDTLPLRGSSAPTPNADYPQYDRRPACVTRRGEVLMASTQRTGPIQPGTDSVRLRLTLLGRNGRVRWSRLVAPCLPRQSAESLLEAPDGGFYAAGAGALMRLDSLGRLLWCRSYREVFNFRTPTYSRRGTLLFSVGYRVFLRAGASPYIGAGVLEVSQHGDSLGLHPVQPAGGTGAINSAWGSSSVEVLRPLRDGGLLFLGLTDTIVPNQSGRPFLARYTSSLQVAWIFALPQRGLNYFTMAQPFELADGTLLVLVGTCLSSRSQPFWFYRFSATGALLQRYPFNSQVLPAPANALVGNEGWVQGLQPLRDSSFVLACAHAGATPAQALTYLAHLRVPGLPRVLDSSFFPLGTRPGAGLTPDALGPPHPNPATETVSLAYALPISSNTATLVLHDLTGRRVLTQSLTGRTGTAQLTVAALPSGLYLATLEINGQAYGSSRKLAVSH